MDFRNWFEFEWFFEAVGCPECGGSMVRRQSKFGEFYGCKNYPNCQGKRTLLNYAKEEQKSQGNTPSPQAPQNSGWYYLAQVIGPNQVGLKMGEYIAAKNQGNVWSFVTVDGSQRSGMLPTQDIKSIIQSVKDAQGQPIKSQDPKALYVKPEVKPEVKPQSKPKTISDERISDEQRRIDAQFEKMFQSSTTNHMMIEALAGTGKTTMLKHLAWKYGKPGQKWLYIVFNKKNKVEAQSEFPSFVTVKTTNGFLGDVLEGKESGTGANKIKVSQTERIVNLEKLKKGDQGGKGLEKARLLIDSREFAEVMNKSGIPAAITCPNHGKPLDKSGICPRGDEPYSRVGKTLVSLLTGMQYAFKEQVLQLVGLSKSFAIDPRNEEQMATKLKSVMDDFDLDTQLEDIKDRISKLSPSYRTAIQSNLTRILGYDFLSKDYAEEIKQATIWMLNETRPGSTQQMHRQDNVDHSLGEFRDFNDDLWFAAMHADEMAWPKYTVVLADEVQDFNEAQKIMLRKLAENGAKVVAVGDANQSIYRFRGADSDAFKSLSDSLTSWSQDKGDVVQKLTKNFRSRQAILDFANSETVVKDLKSGKKWNEGEEGVVSKFQQKYDDTFDQLSAERQQGKIQQTAFIARTNEPLVHAALSLLANKVPFVIVGKDIARDLMRHITSITRRFGVRDNDSVYDLTDKLDSFRNDEMNHHMGKSTKKAYLSELNEITDALLSSAHQFDAEKPDGSVKQFQDWLRQRLGGLEFEEGSERDIAANMDAYKRRMEEEKPVVLTTAHRSKGLEFSRVYILRYDLFPHKKAKRPKDLQQEENAKYVAITRAQDELHILELDGQPGYKK